MPVFPFAFIWQQNPSISDNICMEERVLGHRPLLFFVAVIISHSPKPFPHTPWQYANNIPGLPLYATLQQYEWEELSRRWRHYQIPQAFKKWLIIIQRNKQRDVYDPPNVVLKMQCICAAYIHLWLNFAAMTCFGFFFKQRWWRAETKHYGNLNNHQSNHLKWDVTIQASARTQLEMVPQPLCVVILSNWKLFIISGVTE